MNDLLTVVLFPVFRSKINDYMVSSIPNNYMVSDSYFYLIIIIICLYTAMWFQVSNNNPSLTIIAGWLVGFYGISCW